LDRVDLQVEVGPVDFAAWAAAGPAAGGETTAAVRARVVAARARQNARWGAGPDALNAFVAPAVLRAGAGATPEALKVLEQAQKVSAFSARALDRVLRAARTIADLAGNAAVEPPHVIEAARLRGLDRLRALLAEQR
jgi:magnesium chelatase family protein